MTASDGSQASVRHVVTAVVVAHDGRRWLGELISGLDQQTRRPDRIVAVDTGSQDGSREILVEAMGPAAVLDAPRKSGFGSAVAYACRALPSVSTAPGFERRSARRGVQRPVHRHEMRSEPIVEWLWLLHDDCAPTAEALAAMLELAEAVPTATVVGPKIRDWPKGRRLQEMGVTIAGSGNRETGLEYAEYDQGQHDTVRDVLAVSTAGMLVRRDAYERLGGLDPRLKLFRDDIDFGWRVVRAGLRVVICPSAVVYHAEAGYRGQRRIDAVKGRPRRVDRRNAIYTLLVNCTVWAMPLIALRLVLGSLLRTVSLLVVKWPDAAYDEFRALVGALARPDLIVRGRRRRARFRRVSRHRIRPLFPPPWVGLQHAVDAVTALLSARSGSHAGRARRTQHRTVETGPVSEEAEELGSDSLGVLRWTLTRPPVVLTLLLVALAIVAGRDLLGSGALGGGALLPPPDGAGDLWRRYVETWHPVELGGGRPAPPYLAVVALLATVLFGKVWLAVDILVIGAVPLAGLTAYSFTREIARTRPVRMWAAGTYALLPATTGAVAAGRLGTCVAAVLLPLLATAAVRMLRTGSWRAAWTAGLLLAVLAAFVPVAFVVAVGLGVVACAFGRAVSRVAVALAVPPVLLVPWLPVFAADPRALLGEAGLAAPGLTDVDLPPWAMALGSPGGPGAAPFWILGLLGLAALAALLRRDRVPGVTAAWIVTFAGVVTGLVQSRLDVGAEWLREDVAAWPGFAAVLVVAGWIGAVTYAADGASRVFGERAFSWRQPVAGLLVVVSVGAPLIAVTWWVARSAADPLARDPAGTLPPYMSSAQETPAHPRALLLEPAGAAVRYALLRGNGARLGDAETGSSARVLESLDTTVSELLSDSNRDGISGDLAGYGVGFVYVPPPADPQVLELLDTTPGLSRAAAPEGAAAWQVEPPAGRVRVVPPAGSDPADATVLDSDAVATTVEVPDGLEGRRVVLAEAYDSGWTATVDGQVVEGSTFGGWAQAFEVPAGAGQLDVRYVVEVHTELLALQGVFVLLVVIFALPSPARRDVPGPDHDIESGGRHELGEEPTVAAPRDDHRPAAAGSGVRR